LNYYPLKEALMRLSVMLTPRSSSKVSVSCQLSATVRKISNIFKFLNGSVGFWISVFAFLLFLFSNPQFAMSYNQADERLFSMSLEELMNLEVTSAFKKPQSIKDTPAAVFVITQEDIRRSGATTIPEVLRMVPGVNVAKIDNGNWAISIRGFNGIFSDKLLVLMDGRTLYDPLFSGVFWDVQDTMLEDIERIEVVRGPGASSWGTNAVNGVINIITKDAWSTRGGLVSAGGGSLEHGVGAGRYGFNVGDTGAVRFYAKAFERGAQEKKNAIASLKDCIKALQNLGE